MTPRGRAYSSKLTEIVVTGAVSAYLAGVGLWLILTRQIPSPGLVRIMVARLRAPYTAPLDEIYPEQDHCYLSRLPPYLLSDKESASRLQVYEDGCPMGPGHAGHSDIRRLGRGRFSHWGDSLYFSTSDNSDPRCNGRRYHVSESVSSRD